jgi:hypothetical protein
VNTNRKRMFVLVAALVFLSPAVRAQQPPKAPHPTQEDRIKKLEERADADEKAVTSAAMEKDYITRVQKQYESYYQKVLSTQMWTLGIMGVILTGVFVLVARFSLRMIDEQTKTATAGATVQMRNEYARALAKEVQKLWDSNAADVKKLKEGLTAQFAELEQNLKERSEFQMQVVLGVGAGFDERLEDSFATFRNALSTYKSGKTRNLLETKVGAVAVRSVFQSLRKMHGENYVEKTREELADPLYDGLEEELALAALETPWLAPLVSERRPASPVPTAPETAPQPASEPSEPHPGASMLKIPTGSDLPPETLLAVDEESSCRLLTT